jgi:formylglycine-generating enzyme required for sulfatase activity
MPRKSTVFSLIACLLSVLALGIAGTLGVRAWFDQPLAEPGLAAAVEIGDVAGVPAAAGDFTLELSALDQGGNTQLTWHCGKVVVGMRSDYSGAFTHLQGRLLCGREPLALRAGEIHVSVGSMRGHGEHPAPNALINTVRANRWFLEAEHPTAVFRVAAVRPRAPGEEAEPAVPGWTHRLDGSFELNGIRRELSVPALVEVAEDRVRIEATFPISRAAFEVAARQGFEAPAAVDDEVRIEVRVEAAADPLHVVAALNRELVAQQAATGQLDQRLGNLEARLEQLETTIDELRREFARGAVAGAPAVDVSALPARFTDRVDYANARGDERHKDLGYAAEFEMVLVPGDPARGVGPFYVQTTEVTWEMFRAWSYCEDLADEAYATRLREADLRPSPCYDDASRGFGFEGRAALGLSRRNARAFCRFLSEQAGRSYRLMTAAEWGYLAEASGGLPADPLEVAWLADNVETGLFGDPMPMPVGQKPADALGLHDFWGNVAEWVMDEQEYVRGGSYLATKDELTQDWREDASQDVWNATYPNSPKSRWWYRDRYDMGFRLVCEPVDIPGAK